MTYALACRKNHQFCDKSAHSIRNLGYGAVLLLHGISTLSAYKQYLHPFEPHNLLFFAAWPMLAACFALYYLREADVLWTFKGSCTPR